MSNSNLNIEVTEALHALGQIPEVSDEVESLRAFSERFPGQAVFSTSFSIEDQVITHMIFTNQLKIKVFTLDTGRLFAETYSTWSQTLEKYGQPIYSYFPEQKALENLLLQKGPNSFYESVENRMECCHIRKVEPLKRALAGQKIWITGIRAEHSPNRTQIPIVEWDETNQLFKYHPLLHWTMADIRAFIRENEIPVNPLHEKGFVSIGCAPCTRAIIAGEDFRAGRWWWEQADKKECGLHVHAS